MTQTHRRLGRYELLETLGQGRYGVVYRARDEVLGVVRAIKVLRPEWGLNDELRARFHREARLAARLEHPHIVPVYDFGEHEGRLYLVMRYMEGGSLQARLKREGRLPWAEVVRITREVAEGLAYAHAQGVVHRDLKPGNILFDGAGRAAIGDFGFAKALSGLEDGLTLTLSGGVVGTPAYMAPELWRGQEAGPAADQYALACIVVEMLTGQALFDVRTPAEGALQHAVEGPRFPAKWPEDVPEGIEAVLRKALAREPDARYPDVRAFADALAALSRDKSSLRTHRLASHSLSRSSYDNIRVNKDVSRIRGFWTGIALGVIGLLFLGAVLMRLWPAKSDLVDSATPPVSSSPVAASQITHNTIIRIGHVVPLTGDIPMVGENGKRAIEMWLEETGGKITVGDVEYTIAVIHEDNEAKAESAVVAATKLITEDQVLAIIGPYSSKQAVPTGEVANKHKTPMISPWSTNPRTTQGRPFVFRAAFLDDLQGQVLAQFAKDEFGAQKVAVLYDIASDYPKGLAEFFKASAEDLGMEVVAFESFTTGDKDFSAQLTNIINSGADVLFTPQYFSEVPLIVKQAKDLGWDKPILGCDSWGSAELMKLCGDDCVGYYFSTHWATKGATGKTKEFIDAFQAKYGELPDDVAALTWDSVHLLQTAIEQCGQLTGDVAQDRQCIRDALANISEFDGVTGKMRFNDQGDPIKCAIIVRINEAHEFEQYKMVCPPEMDWNQE